MQSKTLPSWVAADRQIPQGMILGKLGQSLKNNLRVWKDLGKGLETTWGYLGPTLKTDQKELVGGKTISQHKVSNADALTMLTEQLHACLVK